MSDDQSKFDFVLLRRAKNRCLVWAVIGFGVSVISIPMVFPQYFRDNFYVGILGSGFHPNKSTAGFNSPFIFFLIYGILLTIVGFWKARRFLACLTEKSRNAQGTEPAKQ